MAATRAQLNKKVRQEALREQLQQQGHVQHVTDILTKISNPEEAVDSEMLNRYKVTLDTKLKLINKYLPDLKSTEITGDPENPVITSTPVVFIGADEEDSDSK